MLTETGPRRHIPYFEPISYGPVANRILDWRHKRCLRNRKPPPPTASEQRFDLELRSQRTIGRDESEKPKAKDKTRGVARPQDTEVQHAGLDPHELAAQTQPAIPSFAVNKRDYKVFQALFHSHYAINRSGEIAWQAFLHAMATFGFQFEKLYGSVWQYTPMRLDVESNQVSGAASREDDAVSNGEKTWGQIKQSVW
jgi:hypothetical protein